MKDHTQTFFVEGTHFVAIVAKTKTLDFFSNTNTSFLTNSMEHVHFSIRSLYLSNREKSTKISSDLDVRKREIVVKDSNIPFTIVIVSMQ